MLRFDIVDAFVALASNLGTHAQLNISSGQDSGYPPNRKMTALVMSEGGSTTARPRRMPKSLDSATSWPNLERPIGWDSTVPDTTVPDSTVPDTSGFPRRSDKGDNRPTYTPVDDQLQVTTPLTAPAEWNALTAADDVPASAADTETVSKQRAATGSFVSAASGDEVACSSSQVAQGA
jgi:hypothetical protein